MAHCPKCGETHHGNFCTVCGTVLSQDTTDDSGGTLVTKEVKPLNWSVVGACVAILFQAAIAAGMYTDFGSRGNVSGAFVPYLFVTAALWGIVYTAAKAKNRPTSSWLGATFMLGPLPLLLLICLPRLTFKDGESRLCPHCQAEIPITATACRYCTRQVSSSPATAAMRQ